VIVALKAIEGGPENGLQGSANDGQKSGSTSGSFPGNGQMVDSANGSYALVNT
jgi:hypothetical protein